jgi:hypothetical protein
MEEFGRKLKSSSEKTNIDREAWLADNPHKPGNSNEEEEEFVDRISSLRHM